MRVRKIAEKPHETIFIYQHCYQEWNMHTRPGIFHINRNKGHPWFFYFRTIEMKRKDENEKRKNNKDE